MSFAALSRPFNHPDLGVRLLGFSVLAYGLACFLQRDFAIYWQPVPEGLPLRTPLAFLSASLLMLSGLGVFFSRTRGAAALAIAGLFVLYALCYAPRVVAMPLKLGGVWLGVCEQLIVVAGAVVIWARTSPIPAEQEIEVLSAARYVAAVCALVFGLAHFESLEPTVRMVPDFVPGPAVFWAMATGVGHAAVGVALVADRHAVLATRGGALMYASFALLCWIPGAVTHPDQWLRWAGCAISLTMGGGLWLVGDGLIDLKARLSHKIL